MIEIAHESACQRRQGEDRPPVTKPQKPQKGGPTLTRLTLARQAGGTANVTSQEVASFVEGTSIHL